MIIYILKKLFKMMIGNLPKERKRELWIKFTTLLDESIRAAAEGAIKGAIK